MGNPMIRKVLTPNTWIVKNPELNGTYIFAGSEQECIEFFDDMTAAGISTRDFVYGDYKKNDAGREKLRAFMQQRKERQNA